VHCIQLYFTISGRRKKKKSNNHTRNDKKAACGAEVRLDQLADTWYLV